MPRNNLPYVNAYTDRTGRKRYYLRRPGCRQVALAGVPGSREFMQSYAAATSAPPKPKKIRPSVTEGQIYYLSVGDYIKIGFTSNWKQRAKAYRTHTGWAPQVLAMHSGTVHDEKRLHQQFAFARAKETREYFARCPELDDHIQNLTVPNAPAS